MIWGVISFVVEIASLLVIGAIGIFLVGYLTPKTVIWGGAATLVVWLMAPFVDGFTGTEVLNELVPHLMELGSVYPRGIGRAFAESTSYNNSLHNVVGGATVIVAALVFIPFYVAGIVLGVVTWPELILFRLIFT